MESAAYGINAGVVDVSEILVRFLIQNRVRNFYIP